MKGLMMKDLLLLKQSAKFLLLFLAIFCITGLWSGNPSFFVSMAALLCATSLNSTFSYDAQAKWEQFALSAPVSRRQLVGAKYLLALLMTVFATALWLVFLAIGIFLPNAQPPAEAAVLFFSLLGGSVLMMSLLIPLTMKFGNEKGRLAFVISITILFAIIFAVNSILAQAEFASLPDWISHAVWLLPLLLALLFYGSYRISCRIAEKKEY